MRPRVQTARFLVRLGKFVQSLAIVVMRRDDLFEYSRQAYLRPKSLESWTEKEMIDSGLNSEEKALLGKIPLKEGSLLLLGVGGGREAIVLARKGFRVTGVDFIPDMVNKAVENAREYGVEMEGLVQEISALDVPAGAFDVVMFSASMYSCVPTRKRRVEMLKKVKETLKPGGYCLCQFQWIPSRGKGSKTDSVRKVLSFLMGNPSYEKGDMLWGNIEFVHAFSTTDSIRSELEESGLEVLEIIEGMIRGGAILKKRS